MYFSWFCCLIIRSWDEQHCCNEEWSSMLLRVWVCCWMTCHLCIPSSWSWIDVVGLDPVAGLLSTCHHGFPCCWLPLYGPQERAQVCIGVILGGKVLWCWPWGSCQELESFNLDADGRCWNHTDSQQHIFLLWSGLGHHSTCWSCAPPFMDGPGVTLGLMSLLLYGLW